MKPHPIYVAVSEIEYNESQQQLEVSCRVYSNDLETTLKKNNGGKIDLLHPVDRSATESLITAYLTKRFKIVVNEKPVQLRFVGYEPDEEAVRIYFIADNVATVKKIGVYQTILYDFNSQQMGIVHVAVRGERKTKRIAPPEEWAYFTY